jgi:stigma-specific protein Stig1
MSWRNLGRSWPPVSEGRTTRITAHASYRVDRSCRRSAPDGGTPRENGRPTRSRPRSPGCCPSARTRPTGWACQQQDIRPGWKRYPLWRRHPRDAPYFERAPGCCPAGANCEDGACVCPQGQTACGGVCSDLSTDLANCGSCGNVCPYAHICCGCECISHHTDESYCGDCGNVCPTVYTCCKGSS